MQRAGWRIPTHTRKKDNQKLQSAKDWRPRQPTKETLHGPLAGLVFLVSSLLGPESYFAHTHASSSHSLLPIPYPIGTDGMRQLCPGVTWRCHVLLVRIGRHDALLFGHSWGARCG